MKWAAIALLAACDREPITSCTRDLAGIYDVDGRQWHVLDNRRGNRTLEAYPLFDDTTAPIAGLEIAPRMIDFDRRLAGNVTRRYMKGSLRCDAKAPATITACKDNTLEIVLADPLPPIAFDPCTWGQTASSRREKWKRR